MVRILIDRRTFLLGAASFVSSTAIAAAIIEIPEDTLDWLQETVSNQDTIRSPDKLGRLPRPSSKKFEDFALFIADKWGMTSMVSDLKSKISSDLLLHKTTVAPSYLTEYEEMAVVLEELTGRLGGQSTAFDTIAFWKLDPAPSIRTRVGRFRTLVFREFAYYIVSQGGFKVFSPIKNYRGHIGGKFTQKEIPYRGLET